MPESGKSEITEITEKTDRKTDRRTEGKIQERGCLQMSKLYYNGTILTMDDGCPQVEAVLTEGGRIVKRGSKEAVFACKKEETVCVDLHGKTMMPGFLDGHSHFAGLANSLSQCDLSGAKSFAEIVSLMRAYIEETEAAEGQWVVGTNYDHNFLQEKCHPDKRVLDDISEVHPVVLIHASSHMGVTNSLGLQAQNLKDGTEDPAGGHYGRLGTDGELSGYMEENAFVAFRNAMPIPGMEQFMALFKRAQEIYASYGITTMQEGMVTETLFRMLQYAEKNKTLYLDLAGYLDLQNSERLLLENRDYLKEYKNHLKIGGYKIFLDGSPQGRTAWMLEPYEDAEDGYSGYPIKTDEELYGLILTALKNGQQLLAHCNGDAAAEQYITQFENVQRDYPQYDTCRPVMVHAQLVHKEQLKRMKGISMMPSFFIAHTYYWGDIHIQNFGRKRVDTISPAGTALQLGLPFTFHQDSPVLLPDVFRTVWCAAKRITKNGEELDKEERIRVYDALKAMTVHSAYQYFEEDKKGTIEEGKNADLIILDRNPLEIPVDEVKDVQVLETVKDGKTVYKRDKN